MLGSASLDGGLHFITPLEEWAVPRSTVYISKTNFSWVLNTIIYCRRSTATPGQPMAEAEQAHLPNVKYQLKFCGLQWRTYQILS